MGGVMAFKGLENAVIILHGSQGCSTYIRRHMATHYNEPVDIASTSLSEKGTVYGGADNLKKGIKNVVAVYRPEIVGVLTTCLAETIGEDIWRIIAELYAEERDLRQIKIIPVATPGYGGTQTEGYYKALRAVVEELAGQGDWENLGRDTSLSGRLERKRAKCRINVIPANLNPGDIRQIKQILEDFGIDYILLPDVSVTLDAPFLPEYRHIPAGGTKLREIRAMAGAAATIEMGMTVDDALSPGAYLRDQFGVPLYRLPIPAGMADTDRFLNLLSELSGKKIPEKYTEERGRLLDAMIDAHKYNGQARAVIYGDAEQCLSITGVCLESGIKPVLIAAGAETGQFKTALKHMLAEREILTHKLFAGEDRPVILDDTDFETIEKYAVELGANLLIGNSDGRRIEEKYGIDLIRIGFPIHDRVGGQRKHYTGYAGTTALIEETANTILAAKERGYRKEMYDRFYPKPCGLEQREVLHAEATTVAKCSPNALKPGVKGCGRAGGKYGAKAGNQEAVPAAGHPCFDAGAHHIARMHIPVAPACNISCHYCSRKYDCPNESRPGVTSEVLTPEEALDRFLTARERIPNLRVIGIAGPGDALANFPATARSIELIRKADPSVIFCLSTNGLMLPFYSTELLRLGVTYVTVTINAVEAAIGAQIYSRINYLGKRYSSEEGAAILLHNQLSGLAYLSSQGVVCKVNIVMIKGVNDTHVPDVVQKVKEYGAHITNIMKMIPAAGSKFESLPTVSQAELTEMRNAVKLICNKCTIAGSAGRMP